VVWSSYSKTTRTEVIGPNNRSYCLGFFKSCLVLCCMVVMMMMMMMMMMMHTGTGFSSTQEESAGSRTHERRQESTVRTQEDRPVGDTKHRRGILSTSMLFHPPFLARDSVYAISRYMPSPVRLSVRPSHGWISQRRLKLGSCNLHHRVAP